MHCLIYRFLITAADGVGDDHVSAQGGIMAQKYWNEALPRVT